jgi:hypothetical protein
MFNPWGRLASLDRVCAAPSLRPIAEVVASPLTVECLKCGYPRRVRGSTRHVAGAGHCPRCDYVGWAASDELTEDERRALRDVPVEFRTRLRTYLAKK